MRVVKLGRKLKLAPPSGMEFANSGLTQWRVPPQAWGIKEVILLTRTAKRGANDELVGHGRLD
jgi:hypothetical protein